MMKEFKLRNVDWLAAAKASNVSEAFICPADELIFSKEKAAKNITK
jgi:hypothetical protein